MAFPSEGSEGRRAARIDSVPGTAQRTAGATASSRMAASLAPGPGLSPRPRGLDEAVAAAVSGGIASIDPDGGLRFAPPPEPGQPARPPVQRETGDTAPPADASAAPPPAEAPAAAGAPDPAAAAVAPAQLAGPGDLDELARRLYERIRARLRAELRLDMERAGMLTRPGR